MGTEMHRNVGRDPRGADPYSLRHHSFSASGQPGPSVGYPGLGDPAHSDTGYANVESLSGPVDPTKKGVPLAESIYILLYVIAIQPIGIGIAMANCHY